jgi:hypothetical protein
MSSLKTIDKLNGKNRSPTKTLEWTLRTSAAIQASYWRAPPRLIVENINVNSIPMEVTILTAKLPIL